MRAIKFFEENKETALSMVRMVVGLLMVYHGKEVFDDSLLTEYSRWDQFKGFQNPKLIATIGKALELISGIFLTLGLFTRFGAIILVMSMLYITFMVGNGVFWYGDQHPFLFVLLGIIYLFWGGSNWSIDQNLNRKQK